jgi:2-methylcitrate dehydratase
MTTTTTATAEIADSVVRAISDFTTRVTLDDLTPSARQAAKRCLVDAMGCAVGAQRTSVIAKLRRLAATSTSTRPSSLIGGGDPTTPEMAAFVNGSAIRCLDFNDDYFGTESTNAHGDTGPHPSDNLGGVLAAAQIAGSSGADTILGIAIAYEVCGQMVDEVVLRGNGWDHPTFHSIATAAAASRMLGLDAAQTADAIRLALVPNICLYETRVGAISNWKGLAGPNGSRNGLFAALLAEVGITGPELAFEGPRGFMKQLNHSFELGEFGDTMGTYRVENTYFKHLPLRYEMQLPVQLALQLRERVDPREISRLRVFMERKSVTARSHEPALWKPTNRETADHSGPYLIAAALVDGEITEASFESERFQDPELLAVTDTIELVEDPAYTAAFPWRMACRFEVELRSGEVLEVVGDYPKGHPRDPLTDEEVSRKFLGQAEPSLGSERAQQLLQTMWKLEDETSLERLFALTAPSR